jgi:penicillin V acylase-like amidase (Ntn superfamily)
MVTGINSVQVSPDKNKGSLFIGYIVRKLLDHSRTVDEALKLVQNIIPFDITPTEINTHFLVSDATGKSVILEFQDNEWKKSFPNRKWQIMTNKTIFNIPETQLQEKCWRYKKISASLDKSNGNVNWNEGIHILKDVSQEGTTWSVIYLPNSSDIYFSVYQTWDKIYHLTGFQRHNN